MAIQTLASSTQPCLVEAHDAQTQSEIWIRYGPLTAQDCARLIEIQLITNSHDQGNVDDATKGSWSWFDIVLLPDLNATEPIKQGDQTLEWRSHSNRLNSKETTNSTHFGYIFDRYDPLLLAIKPGMVIGVRVAARFGGWKNEASEGWLNASVAEYDIFGPKWSLLPSNDNKEALMKEKEGMYTIPAPKSCRVESVDDKYVQKIWFTTPPIDAERLPRIRDLQLLTRAHNQGEPEDSSAGNWTWFDIVILNSVDATEPTVRNGLSLVWRSHDIDFSTDDLDKNGCVFDKDHPLINLLEVGDVVAVRVSTRFPGWFANATYGSIVVRISHEKRSGQVPKLHADYVAVAQERANTIALLKESMQESTPEDAPPAYSALVRRLEEEEIRADKAFAADNGEKNRPLRLLSLDGGGIRGISSVTILKKIMERVTGDENVKPWDYFDMMAGTSTGGLLAIMLGRLRMTVDEAVTAYKTLSPKIFGPEGEWDIKRDGPEVGCRFSGKKFEAELKAMLKDVPTCKNPDEPMLDPRPDACKVFVLACRSDNMNNVAATQMRTYKSQKAEEDSTEPSVDCAIWEAARATAAAPTYFPRMTVGNYDYVDGGLGWNNPIFMLTGEARQVYGWARPIGCIVTVGTGVEVNRALPKEGPVGLKVPFTNYYTGTDAASLAYKLMIGKTILDFSFSTQYNHFQAQKNFPPEVYWRFNAFQTLKPGTDDEEIRAIAIKLDQYKRINELEEITEEYMKLPKEKERTQQCADRLLLKWVKA